MLKPKNYLELPRHELVKIAADLNVWNSNQPVSDAIHKAHYKSEIAPLHKRIDQLWDMFWAAQDLKHKG